MLKLDDGFDLGKLLQMAKQMAKQKKYYAKGEKQSQLWAGIKVAV